MSQQLQTLSHAPLAWSPVFPVGFTNFRLPGASPVLATGEFGSLCIQEFTGHQFSIRFNVFDIIQRFILRSKSNESGLHTRIMIKGHVEQEMNNNGKWSLRRNRFSILHAASPEITGFYTKNVHISFDTFFSQDLLDELLPLFPAVGNMFEKEHSSFHASYWADTETFELVYSILRCKYEENLRRHFFESRVRDLLFRFLIQLGTKDITEKPPTEEELAAIYKAEQIINEDISKHTHILELSRKVMLNEHRFKTVFKKIFGVGPYEYLVMQRMKRGKELLEEGLSIKEVAAQTGYRPTDFTEAFIYHYGFGPSSVRRKPS